MTTPQLTVATWNLQWKRPGSDSAAMMIERMIAYAPDVICLSEAYADTPLPRGHLIEAEPNYGYPLVEGRRKVLLWSKEPWEQAERIGHPALPPGRFVRGHTTTPLGPVTVIGVCIPWRDAHVSSGRRDRKPWQDHIAYLAGLTDILVAQSGPTIVVGDFNQAIPRTRAPHSIHAALERTLGSPYAIATAGLLAPLGRPSIDHIAHSRDLAAAKVTALSNLGPDGQQLSDHFGVVARFVVS